MPNYTTGPSLLPDTGTLFYNGCTFSAHFTSKFDGVAIKDAALRTVKYMEYTLTVDGYVTMPDGQTSTDPVMGDLRRLLNAQGGVLVYKGRGFGLLVVNQPGGTVRDVAWGPVPETLDFQPLGGGRSAKVTWTVKTRICENAIKFLGRQVLQFNEETGISYDEEGYSSLSIRGTLEIPLTRVTQSTRTLTQTVDDFREQFLDNFVADPDDPGSPGIDLTRFRITRREVNISRDKRTLEFDFAAEELPPMGMPSWTTRARGNYTVRPASAGMGLVLWLCTLRGTYTVRKDRPRRLAWDAFLSLVQVRMRQSELGHVPANVPAAAPQNPGFVAQAAIFAITPVVSTASDALAVYRNYFNSTNTIMKNQGNKAWLMDLNIDEGLYLDSKTITFTATWRLVTTLSHILLASGIWVKTPLEANPNNWATSVRNISGWQSWLSNRLDASQDVIVDFGS